MSELRVSRRQLEEGDLVVIIDHYINPSEDVKKFMDKKCRVIKYTKGGLVNIHIDGDIRKRISLAEYYLKRVYC